jgi:hypothetical protein
MSVVLRSRILDAAIGGYSFIPISAYAGPGDVLTGATTWWGLRAYSLAVTGNNAINLRRDSDNASKDFVTLVTGDLDTGSISSWAAGANLFVTKLYDQTGNGNDIANTTAAQQPGFSLTLGPGGKAAMTFAQASSQNLGAALFNQTTPLILSAVGYPVDVASASRPWLGGANANGPLFYIRTPVALGAQGMYDANTFTNIVTTDSAWHALNGLQNHDGTGTFEIDGVQASGTPGFNPAAGYVVSNGFYIGTDGGGSSFFNGRLCETGVWPNGTTANLDTLNSNQRSYWGF